MLRFAFAILFSLSTAYCILHTPAPVSAQTIGTAWSNQCQEDDVAMLGGILCLFENVLRVILPLAGLALFVMLIVGGIKILTSDGDPKGTEAGKQTLTLAIGGLILAILAWFILVFISDITGIQDLLQFNIPTL